MAGLFDENGNATETHIVAVSSFDSVTGEHISTQDVRILVGTGIPAYSTLVIAPDDDDGYAACWNGDGWVQVKDYRNSTVYSKETGFVVEVREIGPLADVLTDIAPSTPYDKWNGDSWVLDTAKKQAAEIRSISETYKNDIYDLNTAYLAAIVSDGASEASKQLAVRNQIAARKLKYAADVQAAKEQYPA